MTHIDGFGVEREFQPHLEAVGLKFIEVRACKVLQA